MNKLTRRSFLQKTATATAAVTWTARSWSQVRSANDDVRVAVVGFKGRGQDHLKGFAGIKGCRITGLCDVDDAVLGKEKQKWADQGKTVEGFTDIRKLLESKNFDVISIATPNHWHSLAAIWAVQSGKDVYVEKPVSHNVWEGRQLVNAARKYNKIVQTGTQSRSSQAIAEAFAWMNEGNLGKITLARGLCYKPRPSIGKVDGPQPAPAGLDYDLWCGPAPMKPILRKQFHYDWHWIWDTGNGDLGNQGIHQMDICRRALGVNELSPRVLSLGGRLGYVDDGETANTQILWHDYAKAPLVFEVRGLPSKAGDKNMDQFMGAGVGCIIHCEGGHILVPSSYGGVTAHDKESKLLKSWKGGGDHYANFYKAVQSRKHTDLSADILEGHLSSALCHTCNISYRLGQQQNTDQIQANLKSNSRFSETVGRMVDHLKANNVNLDATKLTMGVDLKMNPKTERFLDHAQANQMLTREYRKPYVVPEIA